MSVRQPALLAWAHLVVLWSFAVAQPLFGILADTPEFFVARSNTAADILFFAFGVVLGPPTVLFAIARLAERLGSAGRWVQPVFVGLLAAAIVLQIGSDAVSSPAGLLVVLAVAAGALAALAYARRDVARTVLTVLIPAPAVFLILFLALSPVSKLVFGTDDVAAGETAPADGPPVVMVVFDEFSTEALMNERLAIDAGRYPNIAALTRDGTWYRNATTASDHTTDAVPSLLSGRFPREDALPVAADHPRNLFTLLGGSYAMDNVNEPATDLCPEELCEERSRPATAKRLRSLSKDLGIVYLHRLLPDGLSQGLPPIDRGFGDFANQGGDTAAPEVRASDEVPEAAQVSRRAQFDQFVAGIDGGGGPALNFLHVLLPHTQWQYLPGGQQYAVAGPDIPGLDPDGVWTGPAHLARQAQQRMLLQTGFVDRMVGRLVARLRATGTYDRAMIVLTADHGISFRPGVSRRGTEGPGFPDVAGVPLFVKLPGQRTGGVDDGRATALDVLPTIADGLGIDFDWNVDGRSLLGEDRARGPVTVATYPDLRRVDLDFDDFVRTRNDQVRRQVFIHGAGSWGPEFALGADPGLIGAAPARLATQSGGAGRVTLDGAELYRSVEPGEVLLPAFVTGRLTGIEPDTTVAVAVNGRIRAAASSYDANGEIRVGALVPPEAFRAGANRIELYEALGESRSLVLRAIARSGGAFTGARLVESGGKTVIERGGRSDTEVVEGAADGFVDLVRPEEGRLQVVGWATDPEHREPAAEMLVFADGQLIAAEKPTIRRSDVADSFKRPAIELSGFELNGASANARAIATRKRLRVFAVVDGRASELPLEANVFRLP